MNEICCCLGGNSKLRGGISPPKGPEKNTGHDSWCMLTFYRIQVTFFHTMSVKTLGFKLDPANLPAIQGADLRTCFCFIWSEKKIGQWSQFTTYPKPTSGTDFCDEIDLLDQEHMMMSFLLKRRPLIPVCVLCLNCDVNHWYQYHHLDEDTCLTQIIIHIPWAGRNFANN